MARHFTDFLKQYDDYQKEIYRADFARAVYMYVYGGVYIDTDFVSLKPLDGLLKHLNEYGVILGFMGTYTIQC